MSLADHILAAVAKATPQAPMRDSEIYAAWCELPELNWSKGAQRLHPKAREKYGYEKARRIGMTAMIGGKDKTRIRNATPPEFRDLLLAIAATAKPPNVAIEGPEQAQLANGPARMEGSTT